jgi:hypothetical protein
MEHDELTMKCLARLRTALPGDTVVGKRPGKHRAPDHADGWLRLRGPWGEIDVPYEAKGHVGEANIALVDRRMRGVGGGEHPGTPPWILLTDYVNGNQARRLKEGRIAFADAEGNAHVWGPGLYVWVTGNRPKGRATRAPGLTRGAAARVIFVLLQDPRRARNPYRELAAQAGVVLDTVHRVFNDLQVKGFLKVWGDRERTLTRVAELHELWLTAYEDGLRPKLQPKRCQQLVGGDAGALRLRLADGPNGVPGLLGGEAAAAELTGAIRPTEATIHTLPGEQRAVMNALGLVPMPDGPITLLHTFGAANEWRDPDRPTMRFADPMLIHAELLRMGDDRARAAAAQVYERHIKHRFEGE